VTHPFAVRTAVPDDAPVIARHRAEMFTEMGELSADLYQELFDRSSAWLRGAIASGEYVGWLACAGGDVIAGAGVQVRRILPRPTASEAGMAIAAGREAIVLNVFTEREWRGRGLARLLMRHVLQWARAEAVDRLVLHASEQGRPLYDQLGFVPTTEMRYSGPLR
jgi:GNAT superfamily N-acetyltransferase